MDSFSGFLLWIHSTGRYPQSASAHQLPCRLLTPFKDRAFSSALTKLTPLSMDSEIVLDFHIVFVSALPNGCVAAEPCTNRSVARHMQFPDLLFHTLAPRELEGAYQLSRAESLQHDKCILPKPQDEPCK